MSILNYGVINVALILGIAIVVSFLATILPVFFAARKSPSRASARFDEKTADVSSVDAPESFRSRERLFMLGRGTTKNVKKRRIFQQISNFHKKFIFIS